MKMLEWCVLGVAALLWGCGQTPNPPVTSTPAPETTPVAGGEVSEPAPEPQADGNIQITAAQRAGLKVTASGKARVWEGAPVVAVSKGDTELVREPVRADQGAPAWGTWSTSLTLPAGTSGSLVLGVWSTSARDGSVENLVQRTLSE